jgi:DNA-directed RNA polymerase specialized sigma subunit
MTIFKVAAEMNYSESQVKRIIKSGLARLEAEK